MKRPFRTTSAQAFTLVELMVAVALLSLVIVGISLAFKSTITAVNTANAATDTFSAVQTIQRQIATDLHGLDKDGFLVIRQRWVAGAQIYGVTTTGPFQEGDHVMFGGLQYIALSDVPANAGNPNTLPAFWALSGDRADEIVFMSRGQFANPSGAVDSSGNLTFADHTVADAAVVWYGHVLPVRANAATYGPAIYTPAPAYSLAAFPHMLDTAAPANEKTTILGRHTFLMLTNDATVRSTLIGAPANYMVTPFLYRTPGTGALVANGTNDVTAGGGAVWAVDPRFTAVFTTPSELMQTLRSTLTAAPFLGRTTYDGATFEASWLCYRFRVAQAAQYDVDLAHGAIRTQPTMLPGTASFQVDWTCGPRTQLAPVGGVTANPLSDTTGADTSVHWFGYGDLAQALPNRPAPPAPDPVAVAETTDVTALTPDLYTATFSYDNQYLWPKALRITYRVVDPGGYLKGGRTVVQVIDLP